MSEDVSNNGSDSEVDEEVDAPERDPGDDGTSESADVEADSDEPDSSAEAPSGQRDDTRSARPEHLTDENFFSTTWRGHEIEVSGDWTLRWLFLTPTYTLWIDGQKVESVSGPRLNPSLDAILEDKAGEAHHLSATLTSIVGFRPPCTITIEDKVIARGDLRVANFMNPFLVIFILIATGVMLYVGPDVISRYLP